jgi:hypothetical protein
LKCGLLLEKCGLLPKVVILEPYYTVRAFIVINRLELKNIALFLLNRAESVFREDPEIKERILSARGSEQHILRFIFMTISEIQFHLWVSFLNQLTNHFYEPFSSLYGIFSFGC